jgi:8-oxo-dGTP diphosphatase
MTKITATNSAGYAAPFGLAADAVIFTLKDEKLCVLVARRADEPHAGMWSLPGGFVDGTGNEGEAPEAPEETAERKVLEKTGLYPGYMEQLRLYAEPGRDSRGWLPSMAFLALVPADRLPAETDDVVWTQVDELPDLAFDHNAMVEDGLDRLRGKIWDSNIAVGLLPDEFTLGQAQKVYEAILGEKLDPANFRRNFKNRGLVEPTGKVRSHGPGRPAEMFRFVEVEPTWVTRDKTRIRPNR